MKLADNYLRLKTHPLVLNSILAFNFACVHSILDTLLHYNVGCVYPPLLVAMHAIVECDFNTTNLYTLILTQLNSFRHG